MTMRRKTCGQKTDSLVQVVGRFRLPQCLHELALTTGSFTEALGRYAASPVQVRVLAEHRRMARRRPDSCPELPGMTHWYRHVILEAGGCPVEAETWVWTGGNVDLLRAMRRLGGTPLIRLLRQRQDCRRMNLHVVIRAGRVRRSSLYRIGRARVCVVERFDLGMGSAGSRMS